MGAVAGAGWVVVAQLATGDEHVASPAVPTTMSPSRSGPSETAASSPSAPASSTKPALPAKHALEKPLLGVTAGWELFALGDRVVVRIQPAAGLVTTSEVPTLTSGGPVSFVAGADRVLIRPIDFVPGYVLLDDQPAQAMPDQVATGGPMFPGPDAQHVWVESGAAQPSFKLVALDGTPTGAEIPIPPETGGLAASPDGAGSVLLPATGGLYDARPDGLHRISTGALLATGPTGWLVTECSDQHLCETTLVDRGSGERRPVGIGRIPPSVPGVISPDGATAAIFTSSGGPTLSLVDLSAGREQQVNLVFRDWVPPGSAVWSPDSRWLFVVDADGRLYAVDPHTAHADVLVTSLPPVQRLALRPEHRS